LKLNEISEKRTVKTTCGDISYELIIKEVKNINLRIKPDCSVCVSANINVDKSVTDDFVLRKASYIKKTLDVFAEQIKYQPSPKEYISGESIAYLGKNLRIKLKTGKQSDAFTDGIYLYLAVKDTENFCMKEKCVNQWIDTQCNMIFGEVVEGIYKKFSRYISDKPNITLRNMTSRWGSCQVEKNTITLNKRLIEMPRNCIEYVVTHEFAHFIHPNHSKNFYSFLSTIMPDWKERKQQLEHSLCLKY